MGASVIAFRARAAAVPIDFLRHHLGGLSPCDIGILRGLYGTPGSR